MALEGNGQSSTSNRVKTNVQVNINDPWTIAFWIDGLTQPNLSYLFSANGWNQFRCFSNGVAGQGNLALRQGAGSMLVIPGIADTTEHTVVFVHDTTSKEIKAYKDGKYQASMYYTTDSFITAVTDPNDSFVVAGYATSTTLNTSGLLDEFMIFSYPIDTTKIETLSFSGISMYYDISGCGTSLTSNTGKTFNKSGVYYDTLVGSGSECDTVITYNVELFPSYKDTNRVSGCGSYVLNGNTYNSSTIINDTLKTINGCDSIISTEITIHPISVDTQYFKGCGSYDYNGNTYTSNTVLNDTFVSIKGCDSIIVTDIMIYPLSLDTQKISSCGFYLNNSGDTLRTSTSYYDTFVNQNGCDSVIYMVVNITNLNLGVTSANNTLTADEMNGTYKWLDCDNSFAEISGANAQSFTPTVNGSYAVEVTVESCTDTSDCVTISGLSVTGITKDNFVIAPNPNNGIFTIKSLTNELFTTSILDVNGKICKFNSEKTSNGLSVDMSDLPNGIYFIEIVGVETSSQIKVMKNR